MAFKPSRPCREIGCHNLTKNTYCKDHEINAQESVQYYNRKVRDPRTEQFYKSVDWKRLRAIAFERDNGLCQRCKKRGTLKAANIVHHIVEVKADWSLRLSLDNLESVCHACHNAEHKAVPRG